MNENVLKPQHLHFNTGKTIYNGMHIGHRHIA